MPQSRSLHALLALAISAAAAEAQGSSASDTPLHLPVSRFEFVVAGDTHPGAQPLRIHNGGTARFTDVRVIRIAYADSARGAAWFVAQPRQTSVAADELATISSLCVDAAGLAAGSYRATAAVVAREVPEPVAISITLVVTDAAARAPQVAGRCATAVAK